MSIGDLYRAKKAAFSFQKETMRRYYKGNMRFALCDLALCLTSFFFNPYRVCRKNGLVYGETPCQSLHRIADFCGLTSADCWLELGSGRGKGCFWIAHFFGCQTMGIEKVSLFYWVASAIRRLFRFNNLSFIKGDLLKADFSNATCVYLYSTCMSDSDIALLAQKMETLPPGARIVSISAPLPNLSSFSLAGTFPLSFPWGDTEGYLHVK
jgi:hypothetical protein